MKVSVHFSFLKGISLLLRRSDSQLTLACGDHYQGSFVIGIKEGYGKYSWSGGDESRESGRATSDTDIAMGRKRTVQNFKESSATIYFIVVVEPRTSTVTATMAILSTARRKGLFGRTAGIRRTVEE